MWESQKFNPSNPISGAFYVVFGLLNQRIIRVMIAAGKAKVSEPTTHSPMLDGKFAKIEGNNERIPGSSTSPSVFSNGIKADTRNTRPITKAPTPSSKRCTRSSHGAIFQLCFEKAKLNIPIVRVTSHRQKE